MRLAWVLAHLTLLLLTGSAAARQTAGAPSRLYADSWAVIIGINDYQHRRVPKLRYAVNDALAVERALLAQGFRPDRIIRLIDGEATKAKIEEVLGDRLRQQVGPQDRLLVFFAGHGKTDTLKTGEDEGYLVPVDGDPARLFSTAISMTAIRQISDRLPAKHILYIVDACYSGYALFNRAIADELLEEMVKKPAIQILTAGRQQDQAQERGGHGVFTEVLLRGLQGDAFGGKEWVALEELGLWVKQRVFAESNRKQLPQYGNLLGEGQFVFLKPGAPMAAVQPRPEPPKPVIREEIRQEFGSLALSGKVPAIEVWLGDQKVGETKAGRALVVENLAVGTYQVKGRKAGHKPWEREVVVVTDRRTEVVIDLEPLLTELPKAIKGDDGADMVLIPAGEFWMGSTGDEVNRLVAECTKLGMDETRCKTALNREAGRRRVFLDAYYIDVYEVTNALFERFVTATGHRTTAERDGTSWVSRYRGALFGEGTRTLSQVEGATWRAPAGAGSQAEPTHPVVNVSWDDAHAYCRWAGKRLPSEAEWEKAARGTDGRRYPWGDAWDSRRARALSRDVARTPTAPVGSYPTGVSPYGVHDMAGNVYEWVQDWLQSDYYLSAPERNPSGPGQGTHRVLRGGCWACWPIWLRTTYRTTMLGTNAPANNVGFRCAKSVSP